MSIEKWKKTPRGYLKENWDVALDNQNAIIGLGIIARDHKGSVVAMACGA
jgi:hypothetical protein